MRIGCRGIKLTIFLILTATLISLTSAIDMDWHMRAVDEPFSLNKTGVNTSTVQIVEIVYDDSGEDEHPLVPSKIDDDNSEGFTYFYNKSEGNASDITHIEGKYWIAEFKPNFTRGDKIYYNASGQTIDLDGYRAQSNGEVNVTEDLNVGELKLEVAENIDNNVPIEDKYKANTTIPVEAKVTNTSNGNYVQDQNGRVRVTFARPGNNVSSTELSEYDNSGDHFRDGQVRIPASTNTTYLMHVEASNASGSDNHGTWSKVIQTRPALRGNISSFSSSSGCSNTSMVAKCERGAEISFDYDITAASATGVNLSVNVFNSSGRHKYENMTLTGSSGTYSGSYTIPDDFNASDYEHKIEFEFTAYNGKRTDVDRRNISLQKFVIDSPANTGYLGQQYDLELRLEKPYTQVGYSKSRFERLDVNLTDGSGTKRKSFNLSDFSYDSATGTMRNQIMLNSSWSAGGFKIDAEAESKYGDVVSTGSSPIRFRVENLNASFDISNQTFEVNTLWDKNFTADISNNLGGQNDIQLDPDLPDQAELYNSTDITLSGNEDDQLIFTINMTEVEDLEGDLSLESNQTGYNKTVSIELNAPECKTTGERLCTTTANWVNVSIDDSSNHVVKSTEMVHLGPPGNVLDYNVTVTGDISDYVEIIGDFNKSIEDEESVEFNYTANSRGNFTGKLNFETNYTSISLDTSLEANVSGSGNNGGNQDTGNISVSPMAIDLGTFPSGNTKEETVTLTNNLDSEITNVSVGSSTFTASSSGFSNTAAGESSKFTLTLDSVTSTSGSVTVSAGGKSKTITVSANPIENLKTKAENQLRPRLRELESKANSTSVNSQLSSVSTTIEQIKTAWDSGKYQKAQSLYDQADSTLRSVSNQINSGTSSPPGGGGEDDDEGSGSGGGIPIIPVAVVIVLLLVVAFVFFTSYVPEEGDPLYDYLGEG